MTHVHRKSSAVLLAGGLREVSGYTRSDKNPVDKDSRNHEAWATVRRERRLEEAAAPRAKRVRGELRQGP